MLLLLLLHVPSVRDQPTENALRVTAQRLSFASRRCCRLYRYPRSTTQTFHGGQDWMHLPNFVEDFSVTTNGLGTPEGAMQAAQKAVSDEDSGYF